MPTASVTRTSASAYVPARRTRNRKTLRGGNVAEMRKSDAGGAPALARRIRFASLIASASLHSPRHVQRRRVGLAELAQRRALRSPSLPRHCLARFAVSRSDRALGPALRAW